MSDIQTGQGEHEFAEFGQQIADATEVFLVGLQEISRGESAGTAVPLLLLAGARLGAQIDFEPQDE